MVAAEGDLRENAEINHVQKHSTSTLCPSLRSGEPTSAARRRILAFWLFATAAWPFRGRASDLPKCKREQMIAGRWEVSVEMTGGYGHGRRYAEGETLQRVLAGLQLTVSRDTQYAAPPMF